MFNEELPKIAIMILKNKNGGYTAYYDITEHLNITPTPHICLRAARGERMEVERVANCYLDIYKGAHIRNRPYSKKLIKVIISRSPYENDVMLISRKAMYKLILLPVGWPYHNSADDFMIYLP